MSSSVSDPVPVERVAPPKRFAPSHPWDRNFFLAMIALGWLGILRGFGGEMLERASQHKPAYPLIVHFHALIFVSWLMLFTVQILLVRVKNLELHKRLGFALVGLAAVMALIGPATALTVQHRAMGDPKADPAFLSIQLTDIVAFVGLTAAAILSRKHPSAHKRLILLGTLYITDAGFARWLADPWLHVLGFNPYTFWVALYVEPTLLMALVGVYDLVTRRRLHGAYLAGMAWAVGAQVLALTLYFSPGWLAASKKLIALWPW